jgi:hypothetical protein
LSLLFLLFFPVSIFSFERFTLLTTSSTFLGSLAFFNISLVLDESILNFTPNKKDSSISEMNPNSEAI